MDRYWNQNVTLAKIWKTFCAKPVGSPPDRQRHPLPRN